MVCQEPRSLPFPAFLWVLSDPILPVRSFSFPQRDFFGGNHRSPSTMWETRGKREKTAVKVGQGCFFLRRRLQDKAHLDDDDRWLRGGRGLRNFPTFYRRLLLGFPTSAFYFFLPSPCTFFIRLFLCEDGVRRRP